MDYLHFILRHRLMVTLHILLLCEPPSPGLIPVRVNCILLPSMPPSATALPCPPVAPGEGGIFHLGTPLVLLAAAGCPSVSILAPLRWWVRSALELWGHQYLMTAKTH